MQLVIELVLVVVWEYLAPYSSSGSRVVVVVIVLVVVVVIVVVVLLLFLIGISKIRYISCHMLVI